MGWLDKQGLGPFAGKDGAVWDIMPLIQDKDLLRKYFLHMQNDLTRAASFRALWTHAKELGKTVAQKLASQACALPEDAGDLEDPLTAEQIQALSFVFS